MIYVHGDGERVKSPLDTLPPHAPQALLCSSAASTDFDLTGQIVWPIARLTAWYTCALGERELARASEGARGLLAEWFDAGWLVPGWPPERVSSSR